VAYIKAAPEHASLLLLLLSAYVMQVPVGLSSALGYLHLGQVARKFIMPHCCCCCSTFVLQVPVGLSSALGYLHLGQVARIKVPQHLMQHGAADDTGAWVDRNPRHNQQPMYFVVCAAC
jgi:hypothetical protein